MVGAFVGLKVVGVDVIGAIVGDTEVGVNVVGVAVWPAERVGANVVGSCVVGTETGTGALVEPPAQLGVKVDSELQYTLPVPQLYVGVSLDQI